MKNAIEELKLQLNLVCYDKEMISKLSKVWDAFFKLEERFNSSPDKYVVAGDIESPVYVSDGKGGLIKWGSINRENLL